MNFGGELDYWELCILFCLLRVQLDGMMTIQIMHTLSLPLHDNVLLLPQEVDTRYAMLEMCRYCIT